MINQKEFNFLWQEHEPSQYKLEYFLYLNFLDMYFAIKNVKNPIVVEIGIRFGQQSWYYKKLFNATYIGIDGRPINYKIEKPPRPYHYKVELHPDTYFIQGDSTKIETVKKLKKILNGRKIDLLFIDGDHSYEGAKNDWELYSPLTDHIVAFHDINVIRKNAQMISNLWKELNNKRYPLIDFKIPGILAVTNEDKNEDILYYAVPGIGLVLLDRDPLAVRRMYVSKKTFDKTAGTSGHYHEYKGGIHL